MSPLYTRLKWVAEGSEQPTALREGTSRAEQSESCGEGSEVELQEV